jgi:ABC-type lipoprotein export system ATPase subunit
MFITHILYLPVVSCTSGTYWFDGEEVGKLKESQRTKVRKGQIGFVFQSFNLIDELNVELSLTYLAAIVWLCPAGDQPA